MDSARRKKRRSLSAVDTFTPRTLIEGVLQTAQTVRQSPRKRVRVTPGPPQSRTPSTTSRRRTSRTPSTLPRPSSTANRRHRSTRLETLATPGGSDPTPRGLITGFLQAADPQTPAVYVGTRRSSPLKQPTPAAHRELLQARAQSTTASFVDSPAEEAFSRFTRPPTKAGRTRQHRVIDRDAFAAGVRERMTSDEEEVEEEEEGEAEEREMLRSRDGSGADRMILDSIVEEPVPAELLVTRPTSTTPHTSRRQSPRSGGHRASGGGPVMSRSEPRASGSGARASESRGRTRRSLLGDASFQQPSTSTGVVDDSRQGGEGSRRDSHPSASSTEEDTLMQQAMSETLLAQPSQPSNPDIDNYDAGDERKEEEEEEEEEQEEEEEEEEERVERHEGMEREGTGVVEAMTGDAGEGVEEMDLDDEEDDGVGEEFNEEDVLAPTQPSVRASATKRHRSDMTSMASPLRTPHLKPGGRHPTPAARTPSLFQQAAKTKDNIPLHLRNVKKQKAAPAGARRGAPTNKEPPSTLPRSLTSSIFAHFSKARVPRNALAVVEEASGIFFKNVSKDLAAFCKHAGRNTIELADVELLMKRQRLISNKESLHSLIEKYLPMEYRQELIPMARSGNKVYPKMPKK